MHASEFMVWVLEFKFRLRVQDSGFRVEGLGFRVSGLGFVRFRVV